MPLRTARPRSAHSASACATSAASPPNRWAQPVRSTISAAGGSCATQGLNLPAQRRSASRNAASAIGSAGRVTSAGHMARASRKRCICDVRAEGSTRSSRVVYGLESTRFLDMAVSEEDERSGGENAQRSRRQEASSFGICSPASKYTPPGRPRSSGRVRRADDLCRAGACEHVGAQRLQMTK